MGLVLVEDIVDLSLDLLHCSGHVGYMFFCVCVCVKGLKVVGVSS